MLDTSIQAPGPVLRIRLPSSLRTTGNQMRSLYSLVLISPNSISITQSVWTIQHPHGCVAILLHCFPRAHTLITLMELEKHSGAMKNQKGHLDLLSSTFKKLSLRLLSLWTHYIYFGSIFTSRSLIWHSPYNLRTIWDLVLPVH